MQCSTDGYIDELCEGLGLPEARRRYRSAKELLRLSAEDPGLLYPRFELFARMLDSEFRVLRWNASRIVANLASYDHKGRIEQLLPRYLKPIFGDEMIAAAHAMHGGAQIALAKPNLADPIAAAILKVSRARYQRLECRDVAAGHAIQSLARFFPLVDNKKAVMKFVESELSNPRPATRQKAARFLKKWTN